MKIAKYEIKRSIICPNCGNPTGSNADHLIGKAHPQTFGVWHCNSCGIGFQGMIDAMGQVFVESVPKSQAHELMALLVLPPQKEPVYFLLPTSTWTNSRKPEVDLDMSYYFNEHSCPTNWLGDVQHLQIGEDSDPHGLLRFIRAIPKANWKKIESEVRMARGYQTGNDSSDSETDRVIFETAFPEVQLQFVPTKDEPVLAAMEKKNYGPPGSPAIPSYTFPPVVVDKKGDKDE